MRFLFLLVVAGCGQSPPSPPPPVPFPMPPGPVIPAPPPSPPIGPAPTFANPELTRRVEQLATFTRIESSHVGAAGAPSAAFAAFEAVRQVASEDDLIALLRHPSPVVRGYSAKHLASESPRGLPSALALLDDPTAVGTLEGCMMGNSTVGAVVSDALCWSHLDAARAEVARIARSGTPRAAWAMACIGSSDPTLAGQLALQVVSAGPVAGDERAALLRLVGNGTLGDPGCNALLAATTAPEPDVRTAAAQGLAECPGPASLDALRRLSGDLDATTSRIAKTELALHVSISPAERDALLADPGAATRASVQLSFRLRRPGALARLGERYRTLAIAKPTFSWNGLGSLPASAEALALARAIAAATPVGTNARRDAMGHVSAHGGAADLPEIRRSLESSDVSEVISALEAIARLHDGASRGTVQRLTSHDNASVVRTATATLARL